MDASAFAPVLHLRLFGGCEFCHADKIVRLETVKTSALLAYLVLQRAPQPRHKLIGLLWGNLPEARARANLRHALWYLRSVFSCPNHPPLILTEQQTVAFNPAMSYSLDVEEFLLHLKRESELISDASHPDHRVTLLREAIDLYRGDLLEGFYVDDAPAFEEWLLVERERLRALSIDALHRLVTYYIGWGEYDTGLVYARRLLEMEPWLEETHRQMMRLFALSGQRSAALAQYETCRRVLAEELNAAPSPETQSLYESIRVSTKETQPPRASAPACHLPPQATPFVGRADELAKLADLLRHPSCRLVTLVGPGGVGKTRLAVRAAVDTDIYRDGIFFVPLAGVGSVDLLVTAIADALGLTFRGGANPQTVLLDYLREKEMLLLIDNFEHLLVAAERVAEILQAAPRVKILVTSRERLNLREEWLVQVEGLDYPPTHMTAVSGQRSAVESYSAVQLFLQGAQRARLGFVLADDDQPFVVRLCQLVDGMPLAIELAANWVRILSCQEIVARMEQGMDFLTTTVRDLPARHRSMRAVFEQSWQLLSDEERAVFKRLSVFRGGFRQDAAEAVISKHAERAVNSEQNTVHRSLFTVHCLAALVDKSFLRRNPAGRYDVHELLRQFGEEKLSEEEKIQARDHHAQYWSKFLHQREETARGPEQKQVLDEIAEEMENVRAAWNWAVEQRRIAELNDSILALHNLYDARGMQHEGEETFRRAQERLESVRQIGETNERELDLLLTRLMARRAVFCDRLSRWQQGKELALQSLAHARRLGDMGEVAASLSALCMVDGALGNLQESKQWALENLAVRRALGDRWGEAAALQHLGDAARAMGNYAEAKDYLHACLAVSRESGLDEMKAFALLPLGYLECALGEFEAAREHGQEALNIFQTLDNPVTQPLALCILGQSATGLGHYREALNHLSHAVEIAQNAHIQSQALEALSWMVIPLTKQGREEQALELAVLIAHYPGCNCEIRDNAARLLAELEKQLPPEMIAAAKAKAQTEKLEEAVGKVLAGECATEHFFRDPSSSVWT